MNDSEAAVADTKPRSIRESLERRPINRSHATDGSV